LSFKLICMRGGERVLGVGRNEDSLKKLRSSFNECFDYVVAGPVPLKTLEVLLNALRVFLAKVCVLVNNAGFGLYKGT